MTNTYFDHSWFDFRPQSAQPRLDFGSSVEVAIHLVIHLEAFHLNPSKAAPAGLTRPYPDITNWTQRQVALRDGLARICAMLEETDGAASFVVEADAIDSLSSHMHALNSPRYSVISGGRHAADLHSGFTGLDDEVERVRNVRNKIEANFGNTIAAWCSPAGIHSPDTFEALAKAGVHAVLDLNNDDVPYELETGYGQLLCLPYQQFASDLHCLNTAKQQTGEYLADLSRGVDWLLAEAKHRGPRLLTIPLHPWIIGVPHRFAELQKTVMQWQGLPGVQLVNAETVVKAFSFGKNP